MCESTLHQLLNIVRQRREERGGEKRNGSRRKRAEGLARVEGGGVRGPKNEDGRGGVGERRRRERRKMETGKLKQGAAGDAPGGGRWRVRRFAPRLPVTCPDSTTPRPISLFPSRRDNLFFFFFFVHFLPFFFPEPSTKILRHFRSARA